MNGFGLTVAFPPLYGQITKANLQYVSSHNLSYFNLNVNFDHHVFFFPFNYDIRVIFKERLLCNNKD